MLKIDNLKTLLDSKIKIDNISLSHKKGSAAVLQQVGMGKLENVIHISNNYLFVFVYLMCKQNYKLFKILMTIHVLIWAYNQLCSKYTSYFSFGTVRFTQHTNTKGLKTLKILYIILESKVIIMF